jgi:hypothetical protein
MPGFARNAVADFQRPCGSCLDRGLGQTTFTHQEKRNETPVGNMLNDTTALIYTIDNVVSIAFMIATH